MSSPGSIGGYFVERYGDFVHVGYRVVVNGNVVVMDVGVFLGVDEDLALEVCKVLTPYLPSLVSEFISNGVITGFKELEIYDIEDTRMLIIRRFRSLGLYGKGEVDIAGWMFAGLGIGDCELIASDITCRINRFGVEIEVRFARGYIEITERDRVRRLRRKPVAKLLVAGATAPEIVNALKKLLEIEDN